MRQLADISYLSRPRHRSREQAGNHRRRSLSFNGFWSLPRRGEHNDGRTTLYREPGPSSLYPDRVENRIHVAAITADRDGYHLQIANKGERKRFPSPLGCHPRKKRNDPARGETAVRAALSRAKSLYRTHLTCLTVQLPALLCAHHGAP